MDWTMLAKSPLQNEIWHKIYSFLRWSWLVFLYISHYHQIQNQHFNYSAMPKPDENENNQDTYKNFIFVGKCGSKHVYLNKIYFCWMYMKFFHQNSIYKIYIEKRIREDFWSHFKTLLKMSSITNIQDSKWFHLVTTQFIHENFIKLEGECKCCTCTCVVVCYCNVLCSYLLHKMKYNHSRKIYKEWISVWEIY